MQEGTPFVSHEFFFDSLTHTGAGTGGQNDSPVHLRSVRFELAENKLLYLFLGFTHRRRDLIYEQFLGVIE